MNLLTILQADTTTLTPEDGSSWSAWKWIIILCAALYVYLKIKKKNKHKLEALEAEKIKEKAALLKQLYKDKSAPFFRVKGISFYEPKKPGCYICRLVAEPSNPYDCYAIKIEHPTMGMIGHIPKGNTYLFHLCQKKEIYGAVEIGVWNDGEQYAKFWIDEACFTIEDIAQLVDIEARDF